MLRLVCLFCLGSYAFAQSPQLAVPGEGPRVGLIEIYGVRKAKIESVRKALGVVEGGSLPTSKSDAEERIESIEGIVRANLTAVCCDANKRAILYVGVEEKGAAHFEYHQPPALDLKVPEEVYKEWIEFIAALNIAAQRGDVAEDLTKGHSLMSDPDARRSQEQFLVLAERYFNLLREVLKKSADEEQRGIAAFVLGYAPQKKLAADDLLYAMQDADPTVRNNAMRALSALVVLSQLDPQQGIKISPTWFVEMLNSVHFTDRNKASVSLMNFTDKRDAALMQHIRERALPALIEMAQWRELGHALPAFILLGRIEGLPEERIQELWKAGKRDELLKLAKAPAKKR